MGWAFFINMDKAREEEADHHRKQEKTQAELQIPQPQHPGGHRRLSGKAVCGGQHAQGGGRYTRGGGGSRGKRCRSGERKRAG